MEAPALAVLVIMAAVMVVAVEADDHNSVYSPCDDAAVRRKDGFTFGIAFSTRDSFFNQNQSLQFSPCDTRLSLAGTAQVAIFRPKVDEISILTVNTNGNPSVTNGGYMVAFAGRKYAARSFPVFVANSSYTMNSFTLVLEFKKGTLLNLYWKSYGCDSCSGKSGFVCLNDQDCAVTTSSCKNQGGTVDCSIGIQLAFSGTDKYDSVLNSWYEVSKLRQYSLYKLYSDLKDSLTSQFNSFF